jgi:hypothetical protein
MCASTSGTFGRQSLEQQSHFADHAHQKVSNGYAQPVITCIIKQSKLLPFPLYADYLFAVLWLDSCLREPLLCGLTYLSCPK